VHEDPAPQAANSEPTNPGWERTYLDKLRLAAQVILDAAPGGEDLVPATLEDELDIFKDRVEFLLLLPAGPGLRLGELLSIKAAPAEVIMSSCWAKASTGRAAGR
jgi:hypothetical protein